MLAYKKLIKHLKLLGFVTVAWFLFYLGGLPHYYLQYSFRFMLIFDIIFFPAIWCIVYLAIKRGRPGSETKIAFWFSFYITIPLFFYDLFYCGIHLGYGVSFLWIYWYLSVPGL